MIKHVNTVYLQNGKKIITKFSREMPRTRRPYVHGSMGCGHKSFKLMWRYIQFLSGFLAKVYFSQVSRQSPNDKIDNEIILGTMYRSSGIYLTVEENLSQETVDEGCATNHRFKWGPLPPNEVVWIAQHVRQERRKWLGRDKSPAQAGIQPLCIRLVAYPNE